MSSYKVFDHSKLGIDRCGSPLEIKLADAFALQMGFTWRQSNDDRNEVGRWPGWFLCLFAQPKYGRYRPDFSVTSWVFEEKEGELPPFVIVVEVDGHDFHEKTKEQAERDKSRDRFMTTTDANVLRFTGREVWRDAEACALEVLEYTIRLQQNYLDNRFYEFAKKRWDEHLKLWDEYLANTSSENSDLPLHKI